MSVFLKLGGAPDGPDNYRDTIFLPQTGKTSSDLKNMSFPQLCQIHTMLTYLRCGRRSVEFNESDLKSPRPGKIRCVLQNSFSALALVSDQIKITALLSCVEASEPLDAARLTGLTPWCLC